jgi:hypothetical protein
MSRRKIAMVVWLIAGVLVAETTSAQETTSNQLWGNVMLNFPKGHRYFLWVDFEGRKQTSSGPRYQAIYATPSMEYYPNTWLDLTGELVLGHADQNEDLSSFEVTPRVGFRLQLIGNRREFKFPEEWYLNDRIAISNLLRLEYRNFFYSDNQEDSHEWRLRNRVELKFAINRQDHREDQTLYLLADGEVFVPLDERVPERFANKLRFRGGLGYRVNYKWRVELLYIYDAARDNLGEDFEEDLNILDLRLKVYF